MKIFSWLKTLSEMVAEFKRKKQVLALVEDRHGNINSFYVPRIEYEFYLPLVVAKEILPEAFPENATFVLYQLKHSHQSYDGSYTALYKEKLK